MNYLMNEQKSNEDKQYLAEAIEFACMRWQEATESFDEAFGKLHGLNSAERRCLSAIMRAPQPANAVAKAIGLAPPSVTALIDRLSARDLVHRIPDPNDRRRVLVAPSEKAIRLGKEGYGPIQEAGLRMLKQFSAAEKQVVLRFITQAIEMQERELVRLLKEDKD
ncbi:MarR family transcriptional regulator [Rhizobium tropici]|uniref:MarR family transcriptional regulator n=2 Tax=Rhizobium tropici TaxID=398 RepID=A0A5B0VZX2_RHITR|nr:MarR family transcriptional regulator [Rhizobium tropici]